MSPSRRRWRFTLIRSSVMAVRAACGTRACWKARFFALSPVLPQSDRGSRRIMGKPFTKPSVCGWQQANGLRHYLYLPCYQRRRLTASASESETFLLNLYSTGTFDFALLSQWLRENVAYDASE